MVAMVGIDPASDGLARARRLGVATTSTGVEGLVALRRVRRDRHRLRRDVRRRPPAPRRGAARPRQARRRPHAGRDRAVRRPAGQPRRAPDEPNVNMVTCGGQATIPMVAAVRRVAPVQYAEIVASVSSRSAGPGTRANIDEFTETTATAVEEVGGAREGKAIIVLNPAEPPMIMRDTVFCLVRGRRADDVDRVGRGDGRAGARLRARLPPEAGGAVRPHRRPASRCASPARGSAKFTGVQGGGLPGGGRSRPLPAGLRRQPRHHDRGRHADRRGDRADGRRWLPHDRHRTRSTSRTSRCGTGCTPSGTGTRSARCARSQGASTRPASTPSRSATATAWPARRSTTASAPTPTGSGSRRPPSVLQHAVLTTLLLPGIGTIARPRAGVRPGRAVGAGRHALHRGGRRRPAHRQGP